MIKLTSVNVKHCGEVLSFKEFVVLRLFRCRTVIGHSKSDPFFFTF